MAPGNSNNCNTTTLCVTLFSKALLRAVLKPQDMEGFIVNRKLISEIEGKGLREFLSVFFYLSIKSTLTLKGLPPKYWLVTLKVKPDSFVDFLRLGVYEFPLIGDCGAVDIEVLNSCGRILTRRIRELPSMVYRTLPFMWFIIRAYATERGILRVKMLIPAHEVNYTSGGES